MNPQSPVTQTLDVHAILRETQGSSLESDPQWGFNLDSSNRFRDLGSEELLNGKLCVAIERMAKIKSLQNGRGRRLYEG